MPTLPSPACSKLVPEKRCGALQRETNIYSLIPSREHVPPLGISKCWNREHNILLEGIGNVQRAHTAKTFLHSPRIAHKNRSPRIVTDAQATSPGR